VRVRPFRAPHSSITPAALLGGGAAPRPGEITLAHRGVLFLDELPEFRRDALEALRQPLESGAITIARAGGAHRFPAEFQLVGACNRCPCGNLGRPRSVCRCGRAEIRRYRGRLSGPLLDRVDIQLPVEPVTRRDLARRALGLEHASARERVARARAAQAARGLADERAARPGRTSNASPRCPRRRGGNCSTRSNSSAYRRAAITGHGGSAGRWPTWTAPRR
jgi:magnesium chelatase family protein